jgi:type II secretory pathway component GspD/PulD (secretin)
MLDLTTSLKQARLLPTILVLMGGLAQQAGCAPTAGSASKSTAAAQPPSSEPTPRPTPGPATDTAGLRSERIVVQFSDVDQVASALVEVLQVHEASSDGSVRALLVDHDTNELIVVGTEPGIARVRSILSPAITEQGAGVRVLPLDHARAEDVARSIDRLADPGVVVIADHATNSVVVRGGSDAQERIASLVDEMDGPPKGP